MARYAVITYNSGGDQMCVPIVEAPSIRDAIVAIEKAEPWSNDMYVGAFDLADLKWLLGCLEGKGPVDIKAGAKDGA